MSLSLDKKHRFVEVVLQAIGLFQFERIVVLATYTGQVTPVHPHFSGWVFSVAQLELIRVGRADFVVVAEGSKMVVYDCAKRAALCADEARCVWIEGRFGEVIWRSFELDPADTSWAGQVLAERMGA